ncbi:TPA: hypothetical protein MI384_26295 [Klebsiella pneumoniae]|nr:hypothetical protein [Klebsiella pneumoniae]
MVDDDNFSKKIKLHAKEKESNLKESEAQLKAKSDKISQGISLCSSAIDQLIADIASWVSDSPITLEVNKSTTSDLLVSANGNQEIKFYQTSFFTLHYFDVEIIFSPDGFIKYNHLHDGLIKIDVNKARVLKAYDHIFLMRDKNGSDSWFFSDKKQRYVLDEKSFKKFLLKTLGIE